ncbi:LOW QUALITY PROTEIN: cell division protein Cdc14 [Purpureocillium lavendulum]|uniref:Cell division protein Cdc14 n=1 Tax=Purpureocillium lavendulum TaxID=1247861 RepID=A0AB34FPN3_9HYPO|nr:LOW QUALITY PROTEIN: cell division protein Cdc14 [Purpureocillium lavendulum]
MHFAAPDPVVDGLPAPHTHPSAGLLPAQEINTYIMEALLSLAFDNLSSYDGPKVRKGLRQVEGLLAQICLSSDPKAADRQRQQQRSSVSSTFGGGGGNAESPLQQRQQSQSPQSTPPRKDLAQLSRDPAFREFFKLQEGFEWNVAMRLIGTLDRLMAKGSDGQNDLLILSALDLIQGVLLLHPPSKSLFAREQNMNLLLDLLEPFNCPAIQSATLLTLVVALIDAPTNTRTFEALDGLLTVTSLFKSRSTPREVKLKLVEFLYCYLMPEEPSIPRAAGNHRDSVPAMLQRSPSKLAGAFAGASTRRRRAGSGGTISTSTLSTEDKQELLSRHLSSVEDLVKDLRTCAPFGGVSSKRPSVVSGCGNGCDDRFWCVVGVGVDDAGAGAGVAVDESISTGPLLPGAGAGGEAVERPPASEASVPASRVLGHAVGEARAVPRGRRLGHFAEADGAAGRGVSRDVVVGAEAGTGAVAVNVSVGVRVRVRVRAVLARAAAPSPPAEAQPRDGTHDKQAGDGDTHADAGLCAAREAVVGGGIARGGPVGDEAHIRGLSETRVQCIHSSQQPVPSGHLNCEVVQPSTTGVRVPVDEAGFLVSTHWPPERQSKPKEQQAPPRSLGQRYWLVWGHARPQQPTWAVAVVMTPPVAVLLPAPLLAGATLVVMVTVAVDVHW